MTNNKPLDIIAGAPDKPVVIGDIEIPCYVLEDETRVVSSTGLQESIGVSRKGLVQDEYGNMIPRFAMSRAIYPLLTDQLKKSFSSRILFNSPTSGVTYGYPATILADICDVVLTARQAGTLNSQQERLAQRCEVLVRGFARIGIIALVDEATGYQRIREERALATILERFISEELQKWSRTFPYEFYQEIFRLKGWGSPEGVKRPSVIGTYTNDVVYARLAPGVLDELKRLNPILDNGRRRNRHHQWFTPDYGHPKLKEHLIGVIALMKAAPNWDSFKRSLQRVYPKPGETSQMFGDP